MRRLRQSVEYQARADELDARQAHLDTLVSRRQRYASCVKLALRAGCGLLLLSAAISSWTQRGHLTDPAWRSERLRPAHVEVAQQAEPAPFEVVSWAAEHLSSADHVNAAGHQAEEVTSSEPALATAALQESDVGPADGVSTLAPRASVSELEALHAPRLRIGSSLADAALGVCTAASDAASLNGAVKGCSGGLSADSETSGTAAASDRGALDMQPLASARDSCDAPVSPSIMDLLDADGASGATVHGADGQHRGASVQRGAHRPGRLSASVHTILLPDATCISVMQVLGQAAPSVIAWLLQPPRAMEPVVSVVAFVLCALVAAALISTLVPGCAQPGAAPMRSDTVLITPALLEDETQDGSESTASQGSASRANPRPSPLLDVTNQQSTETMPSVSPPALRAGAKCTQQGFQAADVAQHVQTSGETVTHVEAGTNPMSPTDQEVRLRQGLYIAC